MKRQKGDKLDKVAQEKERLKKELFNELLEFHFDTRLGKKQENELPWRALLEDHIQPHTDILCDFSRWLVERGWNEDAVKDAFFLVINDDNGN